MGNSFSRITMMNVVGFKKRNRVAAMVENSSDVIFYLTSSPSLNNKKSNADMLHVECAVQIQGERPVSRMENWPGLPLPRSFRTDEAVRQSATICVDSTPS